MNSGRLFSLIFLSLFGFGFIHVHSQSKINFRFLGGTERNVALSSLAKIIFSEDNLVVNYTSGLNEAFNLSSIDVMTFNLTSGINEMKGKNMGLFLYPNPAKDFITLTNLPDGCTTAMVYRFDGSLVLSIRLISETQQIDVGFLPKGLYLLKVNNQTQKFIKQ